MQRPMRACGEGNRFVENPFMPRAANRDAPETPETWDGRTKAIGTEAPLWLGLATKPTNIATEHRAGASKEERKRAKPAKPRSLAPTATAPFFPAVPASNSRRSKSKRRFARWRARAGCRGWSNRFGNTSQQLRKRERIRGGVGKRERRRDRHRGARNGFPRSGKHCGSYHMRHFH